MSLPNTTTAYSSINSTDPQTQTAPSPLGDSVVVGQSGKGELVRFYADNYGGMIRFVSNQGDSH